MVGSGLMAVRPSGAADDLVRFRQLLYVVNARANGIAVGLRGADLKHVQYDLRVLWIVLVPAAWSNR